MKYMLDADIASFAMRGSHKGVVARMKLADPDDICLSVITQCELLYGVEVSPRRERDEALVMNFLKYALVLDYPSKAAQDYAEIRGFLKRSGQPIGPNDFLLAAHARSLGLTLVTNNVREFSRVPGLKLENWAE